MPDNAPAAELNRPAPIAMADLAAQRARIGADIERAIGRVLAHGAFLNGPEVSELERQLAMRAGVGHAIACASGTDALMMGLMALGVGPGDAVIVPSFTFTATAEAVVLVGATPVFADVDGASFNVTAATAAKAIKAARDAGLKPAAIIPVDLFGQPALYEDLGEVAAKAGAVVFADAAQSFGAALGNLNVGALAPITATSFYPSKPLGCYGDGGAVLTHDPELAARLKEIRTHGQRRHRDDVVRVGLTSRLDTLQAAVLLAKLTIFDDEIHKRQAVAAGYTKRLENLVVTPKLSPGATSVWAQYTIRSPKRDRIAAELKAASIASAVFYPVPVHHQAPYRGCPVAEGGLPTTLQLAADVISLPMHPYLTADNQDRVAAAVRRALA